MQLQRTILVCERWAESGEQKIGEQRAKIGEQISEITFFLLKLKSKIGRFEYSQNILKILPLLVTFET